MVNEPLNSKPAPSKPAPSKPARPKRARPERVRAERSPLSASQIARVGLVFLAATVGIGIMISVTGNGPLGIDSAVADGLRGSPGGFWASASLVLNFIGGGWFAVYVIPITIVALLCILRWPWSAAYAGLTFSLSAGVVQWLKVALDRPRPEGGLIQVSSAAFPSGHVGNATTLAVVAGILLGRGWVWAVGLAYTAVMVASRIILGAHWLSDTIGGVLVGAGIALVVMAPFVRRVRSEVGTKFRVSP